MKKNEAVLKRIAYCVRYDWVNRCLIVLLLILLRITEALSLKDGVNDLKVLHADSKYLPPPPPPYN